MRTTSTAACPSYDVMLFCFDGVDTARNVLRRVKADHLLDGCEIEGEAFVRHEETGKVSYQERGSAGIGATFGAATAGVIGLVGGPVVLLAMVAAGGLAGGIAGHYAGQIVPGDDLKEVGESLPEGSSAWVALVDTAHAREVARVFLEEGATVIDQPVEADLSSALRRAITGRLRGSLTA